MARVTGCGPPGSTPRPGSVTSSVSVARRRSSSARSSSALRASRHAESSRLSSLTAWPASRRASGGNWPRFLSSAVNRPFLPSQPTRTSSSARRSDAPAISASARSRIESRSEPATAGGRSGQLGLGFLGQRFERDLVVDGQFGQHLAIDADLGLLQAVDEAAVGHAVFTGRSVDALNPQAAEIALLLATIPICILPGLDDRLLGNPEHLAAGAVITFRPAQHLAVATAGDYSTFHSCHCLVSCLLKNESITASAASCESPFRRRSLPSKSSAGDACAWCPSWSGCGCGMRACA